MEPLITKIGALDMQVCVPKDFTDEQVLTFANEKNPCGTRNGWQIRRAGDRLLAGDDERVTCLDCQDKVHIMLDA